MIWAASSAGVGPLCFLKSTVNAAIYQYILENFFFLKTSFMEMLISFSSRTWHLLTLPNVTKAVQWPWCYCAWLASKLAWPEPHREYMGYCQEEDERHQTNNADDLKAVIKATWAFITPKQCHRLIASMPRRTDAVVHVIGGPTKYWVHRNEHTFQKTHFCLKYIYFYWSYVIF